MLCNYTWNICNTYEWSSVTNDLQAFVETVNSLYAIFVETVNSLYANYTFNCFRRWYQLFLSAMTDHLSPYRVSPRESFLLLTSCREAALPNSFIKLVLCLQQWWRLISQRMNQMCHSIASAADEVWNVWICKYLRTQK